MSVVERALLALVVLVAVVVVVVVIVAARAGHFDYQDGRAWVLVGGALR